MLHRMSLFLIDLMMVLRVEIIVIEIIKFICILVNYSWLLLDIVMLLMAFWMLDLTMLCFLKLLAVLEWDTIFMAAVFLSFAMSQFLMSVIMMAWML